MSAGRRMPFAESPLQRLRAAFASLLLVALAGCSRNHPAFALEDIGGLMPPLEFQLEDQDGRPVTADNYRDKVVLLYFGYTHCPDVCPTTLATLSRALRSLGSDASRVQVLFVTVDPQRDPAAILKPYVASFGPQFAGLRGSDAQLEALTRRYRVAYSREPQDADGSYSVAHSSAVFIFQRGGAALLLARAQDDSVTIASDLRRILTSG